MKHQCKITVLETKVFPELQEKYLADPKSGPCPCFKVGDEFLLERTPERDDFYHSDIGKVITGIRKIRDMYDNMQVSFEIKISMLYNKYENT